MYGTIGSEKNFEKNEDFRTFKNAAHKSIKVGWLFLLVHYSADAWKND